MKRILSIALTLCMALSLLTFPANAANDKAKAAADELHELGLFGGVGTNADGSINYDLDRAPSRAEGVTMLVRMLGKEDEAKAGTWKTPFSDVADWAKPYVGYAYTNGLTNGVGDDGKGGQLFGSNATINATQYLTFVLRSLGYESGKDFQWDKAWELTDELGITNGEYNASTNSSFLRSDIALVSLAAHEAKGTPAAKSSATTMEIMGLPKDLTYIANPTRRGEYVTNILYAAATGNYEFAYSGYVETPLQIGQIPYAFPELFGTWQNTRLRIANVDHTYRLDPMGAQGVTKAEAAKNNTAAINAAKSIYRQLHASGKVTEGMTQMQIAQAYYDFMKDYGVTNSGLYKNPNPVESQKYDTAYACLVNKAADCSGTTAAFNLLMHLEGIPAVGVAGMVEKNGHILNYLLLDGKEYMCEFFNDNFPIHTVSGFSSLFKPYDNSLAAARAITKAYADKSVSAFVKAVEDAYTEENFNGKDNETYTFNNVSGNMTVEYLGNYRYKFTPIEGKFTYVEGAACNYKYSSRDAEGGVGGGSDNISGAIEDGCIIMNHAIGGADRDASLAKRTAAAMKDHCEFTIIYNGVTYQCTTQGVK